MTTPITSVAGIGAQTAELLVENGFANAEALAAAKEEDLLKISGFGPSRAKKFIDAAKVLVGTVEDTPVEDESSQTDVEGVEEEQATAVKKEEKPSGPKLVTQKLCKKKKKKNKPSKSKKKKKKKKSSRKKK